MEYRMSRMVHRRRLQKTVAVMVGDADMREYLRIGRRIQTSWRSDQKAKVKQTKALGGIVQQQPPIPYGNAGIRGRVVFHSKAPPVLALGQSLVGRVLLLPAGRGGQLLI